MTPELAKQIEALDDMTIPELREEYARVFGEATQSKHKVFLRKRIAWGLQARVYGGLSERARRRAEELANHAELMLPVPKSRTEETSFRPKHPTSRLLPGSVLTRDYKNTKVVVNVLRDGFEYQGTVYRSLSAIAKTVTQSHWNGRLFFGLSTKGAKR